MSLERALKDHDTASHNCVKGLSVSEERLLAQQESEHVSDLFDQYLDDNEILWDTIIDEGYLDSEAFCATLSAMVCAQDNGNDASLLAFAKSIAVRVKEAVQLRAEKDAEK